MSTAVSLPNNWMDSASDIQFSATSGWGDSFSTTTISITGNCTCNNDGWCSWCRPTTYYYNYPIYTYPTYTKVRLTIDEVNRLRAAAKKDRHLKAILQKLTPAIEVEVEFGEKAAA